MIQLQFRLGNAKLGKRIWTFSLPAGYTCPGAKLCRSRLDRKSGKIVDGKETVYRCFAASGERIPNVRVVADHNLDLLKGLSGVEMEELILASLPPKAEMVRVHVGGDFFSENYFRAWMRAASRRPETRFYAYTKSLPFWIKWMAEIPGNFRLTASEGGNFDHLITRYGLKTSKVVFTIEEAMALGLEIDHDDSHAYEGTESFALLIHGIQPAGSAAGQAVRALAGVGSYGKGAKDDQVQSMFAPEIFSGFSS